MEIRAVRVALDYDCGEIPICENGTLVGVVTDRDIACRAPARGQNPIELTDGVGER